MSAAQTITRDLIAQTAAEHGWTLVPGFSGIREALYRKAARSIHLEFSVRGSATYACINGTRAEGPGKADRVLVELVR